MKNKKALKALIASMVCSSMAFSALAFTACDPGNNEGDNPPSSTIPEDPNHTHSYSNSWSSDSAYHWHDATCGHDVTSGKTAHNFVAGICDVCGKVNRDAKYYTALSADDINNDDSVATYEDETVEPAQVAAPKVVANTGNGVALEEGQITSTYEFDAANLDTKSYTDGWTDGIFSIAKNTEVRGRIKTNTIYDGTTATNRVYETKNSVKLGDNTSALSLKASSAGTLEFYVLNGSSGTTGTQSLSITKPSGSSVATTVNYPANGNSSNIQLVTLNIDVAGTYTIMRASGTSDIYYAKFTTSVDNTPIQSINIASAGKTEYLVGQQLDCTGIAVTATHATTGRISPVNLENLVLDTSAYNPNQAGTYTIGVSYTLDGNLGAGTTFTTSYTVKVYDFDDFTLGFDKIVKEAKNSAAGNGVYFNHTVDQFYFVGDTFSYDGLSIIATGKLGSETKEFALDETQAVITGNSTATAGKQSVKVAYTTGGITKAKGFNVYVADKGSELATADYVNIAVNPEFSSKTVGTKNEVGAYRFKTVQQALNFIEASGMKSTAKKYIYLAEGTYWEKLEVTSPNVALIGAGQDKTKIEYDALYGVADAGGFVHTTDSTATLNVRDTAVGFSMENLTVSNYYNTLESYNGAASNDKRALAMLIQADKVVIKDSTLLGFQDTLELFTGRQIFENCLISGSVDFIFGTNNITYFHKCEIRVVANGSNGGYLTAFKGLNKGKGTDDVTYGTVFDDCDFTAESGVPVGKTSIGRAWGATAAVMVMNSRLGKHISKTADTNSGGRYISMGNGDPKDARFTEYNNTGDGAISASIATVKILEETAAAKYNDISFIFGKNANSLVKFSDVWNPELN